METKQATGGDRPWRSLYNGKRVKYARAIEHVKSRKGIQLLVDAYPLPRPVYG